MPHCALAATSRSSARLDGLQPRRLRPRVEQQIVDLVVEAVDALDHRGDDLAIARLGDAPVDHLERGAQAGQRIANLVRDDGGELAEMRQRRLLPQLRLGALALR